MDVFVHFIESDSFFPVLMLLLLALLFVFAWAIYSGKRNLNSRRFQVRDMERMPDISNLETEDYEENQLELISIKDGTNDSLETIEQIVEEPKDFEETSIPANDPINSYDDIELIDAFKKPLKEIEKEEKLEMQEQTLATPEVLEATIEMPIYKIIEARKEDKGEKHEDIKNMISEKEEKLEDTIELPHEKEIDPFAAKPDRNRNIQEAVEVPTNTEYTSEKTEIFDFPDFSDILTNSDGKEEIESEVLANANKYIENIMAKREE